MPTWQRSLSGGKENTVSYWGGPRLRVEGEQFDAMKDAHCNYALRSAEDRFGPVNVLKVGFWNPKEPDADDPNEAVIDFTDAVPETAGFELVGDHSVRAVQKSNIGVIRNPRGLVNFGFRVADSHWGILHVLDGTGGVSAVFFLHLGRDCIMPARPNGGSVFDTVSRWCTAAGIDMCNVTLETGGGIQRCCYRFPNADQLKARVTERYGRDGVLEVFDDEIMGPQGAKTSMDLQRLIELESSRHRIYRIYIEKSDEYCTACYGHGANTDSSKRLLYSNARGDGTKRNLCVVSADFGGQQNS